jgi:hypothetical protein
MTKDCSHPRYYSCEQKAHESYSGLSDYGLPIHYSEIDPEKVMAIVCASVERLELFGREMFLVSDRDKFKSF